MKVEEQLEEWVKGNSIHNEERDECCPDFSCCKPDLLADEETRKAFCRADAETRVSILGMFLGEAMALAGKNVHVSVAGEAEAERH